MKKRLFLLAALAWPVLAQTFEVAAIHPNIDGAGSLIRAAPGGMLTGCDVTLQTLIRVAYRIPRPLILGPSWLSSDRFDVIAKGSADDVSLRVMAPKIRNLLAERFGLRTHQEIRTMSALALMGVGGLTPREGGDGILYMTLSTVTGKSVSMDDLARALTDVTGDLFVDESGYEGRLDVDLSWRREDQPPMENALPSLQTILHDLGIEVRVKKAPVAVLVIEHVDRKPTDN